MLETAYMDVTVKGAVKSSDNTQVHYVTDDPKASYTLVNPADVPDVQPTCIDWVDPSCVDYNVLPPPELEDKYKGSIVKNHGVPLSYLQIQTVEEGTEYYKATTKYPDAVCEMLARYEWGDLRYTTKKEFKNLAKKTKRKRMKHQTSLTVKNGPVILEF